MIKQSYIELEFNDVADSPREALADCRVLYPIDTCYSLSPEIQRIAITTVQVKSSHTNRDGVLALLPNILLRIYEVSDTRCKQRF